MSPLNGPLVSLTLPVARMHTPTCSGCWPCMLVWVAVKRLKSCYHMSGGVYSIQILLQKLRLPQGPSAYLPPVALVVFFASAFRGCFREGFSAGFRDLLPRKARKVFEDYGKGSCACCFRLTPLSWVGREASYRMSTHYMIW